MEAESNTRKIAFGVVGIIVIAAALFALWYRSQSSQQVETTPQNEAQTQGAQVIEAPKDDPYGKLSIPPAQ